MPANSKAIGNCVFCDGLVICLGWRESAREFATAQEVPVDGARRIVEMGQNLIQLRLIPQRQNHREVQSLSFLEWVQRPCLAISHDRRDMPAQLLQILLRLDRNRKRKRNS